MPVGKHGYLALPEPLSEFSAVVTQFVYPPIPDRSHDWLAYLDGREEDTRFYGFGATESEARRELAAAIGAWEEERGERAWEAWRESADLMKDL